MEIIKSAIQTDCLVMYSFIFTSECYIHNSQLVFFFRIINIQCNVIMLANAAEVFTNVLQKSIGQIVPFATCISLLQFHVIF